MQRSLHRFRPQSVKVKKRSSLRITQVGAMVWLGGRMYGPADMALDNDLRIGHPGYVGQLSHVSMYDPAQRRNSSLGEVCARDVRPKAKPRRTKTDERDQSGSKAPKELPPPYKPKR